MNDRASLQLQQGDTAVRQYRPGLLEAVWRHRWLVATAMVVAAVAGFAVSHLQSTMYESEVRMLLTDPRAANAFGEGSGLVVGDGTRYVRNQAQYVESTPVMERASELVGGELSPSGLARRTTVEPATDLDLITIRVSAPSAQLSADAANAVGQAYQEVRAREIQAKAAARIVELEDSLEETRERLAAAEATLNLGAATDAAVGPGRPERDAMAARLVTLENRISQLSTDASLYGSGVELFEWAVAPSSPSQPRPTRNAAVSAVLGILAASAFAWWRTEQTMDAAQPGDAAAVLGAPLLGKVPDFAAVGVRDDAPAQSSPHSAAGEAYQFILAALEVIQRERGAKSILVTSAGISDGKTITALNLAIAAARDGREVLLVDADERARGLSRLAGIDSSLGFTGLGDLSVPLPDYVSSWHVGDGLILPFVAAGRYLPDPAVMYRSTSFRRGAQRLADAADLVVIDTPPALLVSDAVTIAGQFDGLVVVVHRGTPLRALQELRERLDLIGVPVLGYVFNRASRSQGGGYTLDYEYGHSHRNGHNGQGEGGPSGSIKALQALVRRR